MERVVRLFVSSVGGKTFVDPEGLFVKQQCMQIAMERLVQNPDGSRLFVEMVKRRDQIMRVISTPHSHLEAGMLGKGCEPHVPRPKAMSSTGSCRTLFIFIIFILILRPAWDIRLASKRCTLAPVHIFLYG
jgi:hypothetical protein